MQAIGNVVRIWVKGNSDVTNPNHCHLGEVMNFGVMKKMHMIDGEGGVLHSSLQTPGNLHLMVSNVETIDEKTMMFTGTIAEDVGRGVVLPNFRDNAGLSFLTADTTVVVKYFAEKQGGFLTFEDPRKTVEWVRVRKNGEMLDVLECFGGDNGRAGFCFEIINFAKLPNENFDKGLIRQVGDIVKCTEINTDGVNLFSNLRCDLPVVWT